MGSTFLIFVSVVFFFYFFENQYFKMPRLTKKTIANRKNLSNSKNKKIKIQKEMLDLNFSHAFDTNFLKHINNNVMSSDELNSIPKFIDSIKM